MNGTEKGLKDSKWASTNNRSTNSNHRPLRGSKSIPVLPKIRQTSTEKRKSSQLEAYAKLLKTHRRLKWKSTSLLHSWDRALHGNNHNIIAGVNFEIYSDTGKANVGEIMFKADFFEYFVLLERCLVHLLECVGQAVSAGSTTKYLPLPSIHAQKENGQSLTGDSASYYGYSHRFHANVLAALDDPSNPLHQLLGTGKVRLFLGIAKEFRNRWKNIEQEKIDDDLAGLRKSYHQIVQDLKLDAMLLTILTALEDARSLASQHLATIHGSEVEMVSADEEDDACTLPEDTMDWD